MRSLAGPETINYSIKMEQNNELSAQRSFDLINETLEGNRRSILRNNGKYFLFWGCLLTFMSLLVYVLWKTTGKAQWNFLWFAMPVVGYPVASFLKKRNSVPVPANVVSRMLSGTWATFGIFACLVAAVSLIYVSFDKGLSAAIMAVNITSALILLFGMAETICGVILKNWIIRVAGIVTGIGGMVIYYLTGMTTEQLLIFTFAGIVLALTGVFIKLQNR